MLSLLHLQGSAMRRKNYQHAHAQDPVGIIAMHKDKFTFRGLKAQISELQTDFSQPEVKFLLFDTKTI